MTHVFSLGHLMGRPGSGPLADHGVRALTGRFHDAVNGGWYAGVAASGEPTSRDKAAYGHAFVVLAAASATCAGRPGGRELLDEALSVMLDRFWDDEHGMVVEEWDETFSTLDGYRGVNANMHTVEAFLAAADAVQDADRRTDLLGRALRIVTRVVHDLGPGALVAAAGALRRGVDARARLQPSTRRRTRSGPTARRSGTGWSGPGWRSTCGPRSATTAPAWLLDDAVSLFDASVREGWAVDGADGFVYTVDWEGTSRRPRADALGRGGGDGHRGGAARRDRRPVVRRTGTPPGGTTSRRCSSTTSWGPGATSSTRRTGRAA